MQKENPPGSRKPKGIGCRACAEPGRETGPRVVRSDDGGVDPRRKRRSGSQEQENRTLKKWARGLFLLFLVLQAAPPAGTFALETDMQNTPGRYFRTLYRWMQPRLPREMTFRRANLLLLPEPGAELKDLCVAENPRFGREPFLRADQAAVRVRLLPVFLGRIHLKELTLEGVAVRLLRNAQGEYNIQDLVQGRGVPSDAEKKRGRPRRALTRTSLFDWLLISEFSLQNGRVLFQDAYRREHPANLVLDPFRMRIASDSSRSSYRVACAAGLPGEDGPQVEITGRLGPLPEHPEIRHLPMDLALAVRNLSLEPVAPLLPERFPLRPVRGTLGADLQVTGSLASSATVLGEMRCDGLRLDPDREPEPPHGLSLRLLFHPGTDLAWEKGTLSFDLVEMEVNGSLFSMAGRMDGLPDDLRWNVSLRSEGIRFPEFLALHPFGRAILRGGLDISGPVEGEFATQRETGGFQASGDLRLGAAEMACGAFLRKGAGSPCRVSFRAEMTAEGGMFVTGAFQIRDGTFMGSDFMDSLLERLPASREDPGPPVRRRGNSPPGSCPAGFASAEGSYSLAGPRLSLQQVRVSGLLCDGTSRAEVTLHGDLLLDTGKLDLRGQMILNEDPSGLLLHRSPRLRPFLDCAGRLILPFEIRGSLREPRAFPGPAARTSAPGENSDPG